MADQRIASAHGDISTQQAIRELHQVNQLGSGRKALHASKGQNDPAAFSQVIKIPRLDGNWL